MDILKEEKKPYVDIFLTSQDGGTHGAKADVTIPLPLTLYKLFKLFHRVGGYISICEREGKIRRERVFLGGTNMRLKAHIKFRWLCP